MKVWTFQDHRQKQKLGAKAPWSVGWVDPEGRRKSKRVGLKSSAEKYRRRVEGELAAGVYENKSRKSWADFRAEYEVTIMPKWRSEASRHEAKRIFNMFEKVAKPTTIVAIDERMLDRFVAKRLTMPGKRRGDPVSSATVNKELRTICAALNQARKWKYITHAPDKPEVDEFDRDKPSSLKSTLPPS